MNRERRRRSQADTSPGVPGAFPVAASDEQLVRRALAGADGAFAELVERYQARLLRFLVARCVSRADAEDALQDTFVNAFHYLESYDSRWRFSTWLYRIAIRNAARRAARGPDACPELPERGADPLEECIAESERENLWLAAKRLLSAEACAAMWLRYAEDMPVKEVARALGRPETWTRVVLLRARRRLMKALRHSPDGEQEGELYG